MIQQQGAIHQNSDQSENKTIFMHIYAQIDTNQCAAGLHHLES